MYIVQIAAELAPIAKVGGLADVVLGLSRSLSRQGQRVEILLPKYRCLKLPSDSFEKSISFTTQEGGKNYENKAYLTQIEGCKVWLLDVENHPERFFQEEAIYAGDSDIDRYLYFSRMALDFLQAKNEAVDILHLHDWHVSFAALLQKEFYPNLAKKIVLNIHNLQYQGKCGALSLEKRGFNAKKFLTQDKLLDDIPEYHDSVNLLKGGILYSDQVVTVSPNYSKEILTVEMSFGLERTLRSCEWKLKGILNGIDNDLWSPEKDGDIPHHYSPKEPIEKILDAKAKNKKALQRKIGLKEENAPLICSIGRLVPQKGPELIKAGLLFAVKHHAQGVLLGSVPEQGMEQEFERLSKTSEKGSLHFHFLYDEHLSRLLYAASDFIIIPSLFEPCGLTQLLAFRYGTIPIVRRTGGLADTVFDADRKDLPDEKKNGYTFDRFDTKSMEDGINRALIRMRKSPLEHQKLLLNGIQSNFGWDKPAAEYAKLYQDLLTNHK